MTNEARLELDNKTLTKLAIAIATAIKLQDQGEAVGPMVHKILEQLRTVESLPHFEN